MDERVRSLAEAEQHVRSLTSNDTQLWAEVRDIQKRLDTLQTPMWKRVLFRLDGWPGIRDLNAPGRHWRPWHRRS